MKANSLILSSRRSPTNVNNAQRHTMRTTSGRLIDIEPKTVFRKQFHSSHDRTNDPKLESPKSLRILIKPPWEERLWGKTKYLTTAMHSYFFSMNTLSQIWQFPGPCNWAENSPLSKKHISNIDSAMYRLLLLHLIPLAMKIAPRALSKQDWFWTTATDGWY